MKTLRAAPVLAIKAIEESGKFSGYGSIFGNVDSARDIVEPGAFAESLAEHRRKGSRPKLLWQHNPDEPIGRWLDLAEDGKGLFVLGQLNMGVQRAREAHALLKEGDIDGLSIGYSVVASEPDAGKNVIRLKKLWLYEISIVSMAANDRARVDDVKGARFEDFARRLRDGDPPSIKEFEDILREAGVPKAMATQIASVGYSKAIRSESEGKAKEPAADAFRALRDALDGFRI
jgi:HK97 family phage prohead protease